MLKRFPTLTFFSALLLCLLLGAANAATGEVRLRYAIQGIDGSLLKNVQARLAIEEEYHPKPLTAAAIQDLFQQGPASIKAAMAPYGYLKPSIQQKLEHKGKTWTATYHVKPGPRLRITSLEVRLQGPGRKDKALQKRLANFPLKQGQPFSVEAYNKAVGRLYRVANQEGYLDGKLSQNQVSIDKSAYTSHIQLVFDTGQQYYFGPITFGKNPLSADFLKRYIPFKQGAVYSTKKLAALQQNLSNSGYYQQVILNPDKKAAKNYRVPVQVNLVPLKKKQYRIGGGYGTDTGIRGSLGMNFRHLTDTGQHFESLLTASQINSSLAAKYVIPGENPLTDQYFVGASVGQLTPPNDSESFFQKLTLGYITALEPHWQQTLAIGPQHEHYSIDDGPYQDTTILLPSATWSHITYDDPIFPLYGNSFSFMVRGANKALLSTTSFLQLQAQDKWVYSITDANRFLLRANVGYTFVDDLDDVPLSLQFFAGGAQSLRAYRYQDLGPGHALAVGSAEYQRKIIGHWYGTVFYDVGNASNHILCRSDSDDPECGFKRSPGVGVVWASPLGPLALSVARALDKEGEPFRLSFSMGANL